MDGFASSPLIIAVHAFLWVWDAVSSKEESLTFRAVDAYAFAAFPAAGEVPLVMLAAPFRRAPEVVYGTETIQLIIIS